MQGAPLARISRECAMDVLFDVNLLRRIVLRCREVSSSTGFSLCTVDWRQLKPHRLKPVLLDRAGPVLQLPMVKPSGNFRIMLVRNAR